MLDDYKHAAEQYFQVRLEAYEDSLRAHGIHCVYAQPRSKQPHYSVYRYTESRGQQGEILQRKKSRDLIVIWDEDHDLRVLGRIEELFLRDLLFPILYIGEREGCLTLAVDPTFFHFDARRRQTYTEQVERVAEGGGDAWGLDISVPSETREFDWGFIEDIRARWGGTMRPTTIVSQWAMDDAPFLHRDEPVSQEEFMAYRQKIREGDGM